MSSVVKAPNGQRVRQHHARLVNRGDHRPIVLKKLPIPLLVHTLNPTVLHKKKKTKKQIRIQDLKPRKDVKGGMPQGPPHDPKWILTHLQLGFR